MPLFDVVVILLTWLEYGKHGRGVKQNRPGQPNPRGCPVQESASKWTSEWLVIGEPFRSLPTSRLVDTNPPKTGSDRFRITDDPVVKNGVFPICKRIRANT